MDIFGKYYSTIITTGSEVYGSDLFDTIETDLGISPVTAKKLTVVSSGSLSVQLNDSGTYYVLSDYSGSYLLQLNAGDVYVNSLKIKEGGRTIFVEIVY